MSSLIRPNRQGGAAPTGHRKDQTVMIEIKQPSQRDYTPFVLTADARDGSGMVMTALSRSPETLMMGEVFGSAFRPAWGNFNNAMGLFDEVVYPVKGHTNKVVGFKLFRKHADRKEFGDLFASLRAFRPRVIHLRRRNLLEKFVSFEIARRTGKWFTGRQSESTRLTLKIDAKDAAAYFELCLGNYESLYSELAGLPCVVAFYEDFLSDFSREIDRIQSFLGIPSRNVQPTIVKQERRRLPEIIENYDSLARAFKGTQWEPFLPA
ncbi:MAG: LPS sulfotransferase NodH [Candidatus Binatia bacterium]